MALLVIVWPWASADAQQSPTQPAPVPTSERFVSEVAGSVAGPAAGSAETGEARPSTSSSSTAQPAANKNVQVRKQPRRPVTVEGPASFNAHADAPLVYPELPETGEMLTDLPSEGPLVDFLPAISEATGWNVVASSGLNDLTVHFWLKKATPKQALEMLEFTGVYYDFNERTNTLYVMTVEEYLERQYGAIRSEEIVVEHADVIDMEQTLAALKSANGRLVSDPRTGRILVWDTEANIGQMREAVKRLDVPLKPRVFPLKYVQAENLLDSVELMLSERGIVQADPRVNTLVVTDLPSRIEEVARLVEALDRKVATRTWTIGYADVETIQERLESIIPEESGIVTIDKDTHQVSVTALPERIELAAELIAEWDVQPRQVQIEAYLVSADTTVTRNFGIDWAYFDSVGGRAFGIMSGGKVSAPYELPEDGQRISLGRLPYTIPMRNFYAEGGVQRDINGKVVPDPEFQGDNLSVVLDYLNQTGKITILSKPRVTVKDGLEASFERTEELPYQNVGFSTYGLNTNSGNNITSNIIPLQVETVEVGTVLTVKPRIAEDGNIVMEIEAEDSTAERVPVLVGDRVSTIPQKRQNRAETSVVIHDGQTIVIGGLRSASYNDSVERVPVLGELPIVGRLFKSTEKERKERDLLVFLTTTIVDAYTKPEAEKLSRVDAEVAEKLRTSLKPIMERIETKLSGGSNEVHVAIGQAGTLYTGGKITTLENLHEELQMLEEPEKKTLVIRAHPSASPEITEALVQAAGELGMKSEVDRDSLPFVPAPAPKR